MQQMTNLPWVLYVFLIKSRRVGFAHAPFQPALQAFADPARDPALHSAEKPLAL
jgi:hypothetical protein